MRLGLFGGTFDPVHLGHLVLAESCREALGLDRVWFVVAGRPPHKQGGRTAVADRIEMVRIAVAGNPCFAVSEVEAHSPGPHYTYRTLEAVARDRPGDELFFLIGGDSLVDLPSWREPGRVMAMATVVAVGRPGYAEPAAEAMRAILEAHPEARPIARVDAPLIGIASRELRGRVAEGRSVRYLVPRGVEAYIEARGLYRGDCGRAEDGSRFAAGQGDGVRPSGAPGPPTAGGDGGDRTGSDGEAHPPPPGLPGRGAEAPLREDRPR